MANAGMTKDVRRSDNSSRDTSDRHGDTVVSFHPVPNSDVSDECFNDSDDIATATSR